MNRIKILFVIALISLVLVGCQKDQEFTSEAQTESITNNSNHTHPLGRSCASKTHLVEKMQDPAFKAAYEERMKAFEQAMREVTATSRAACNTPVVLPVAIHYQGISSPNKSCLTSLAEKQVQILNADFQGKNSDLVQWTNTASNSFPNINDGALCVQFKIATQNHPTGYNLSNGQPAITFNQTNGDQLNKWSGYINIIVNNADGNLGYAPLGGAGNGDGVVINKEAFGAGAGCGQVNPQSPFNLGRTLTHEMGHYLNLDHLWGNGGCTSDDLVSDTPKQSDSSEGCPSSNKSTCGSKDLHMNYMDYANDVCMYMFTAGQTNRMNGWLNGNLKSRLKTNVFGGTTGGGDTGGGDTDDTCSTPTGLTAQAIGSTSFKASWSATTNVQTYQLRYRKKGTTSWIAKNTTSTNTTISSLTSNATYEYRLRARCADGTLTAQTAIKSITLASTNTGACSTPTGLTAQTTSNTSFTASWSATTNVQTYQLRYRKQGTTIWKVKNVTSTSTTIGSLTSGATYQYRLRARCNDGQWTAQTTIKTITLPSGGSNNSSSKITIKVTLDDFGSETSFDIEDSDGKVVRSWGPFADGQAGKVITRNIDLPRGAYTFVIYDDYGDGICCYEGNGKWQLFKDGTRIKSSNGKFGYWEEYDFTVGSARLSAPAHRVDPQNAVALAKKKK